MITNHVTDHAAVIVYGPIGCGKTHNCVETAELFGKSQIIDDWKLGDDLPHDAVCLTSDERVHGLEQFQMPGFPPSAVFEFADVMREVERMVRV